MNKPKICAVIVSAADIAAAKKLEPLLDLFEVRLDLIGEGWQSVAKQLHKPWIATNRIPEEGGKWQGTEEARIETLRQAIELGASMVDLELRTKNLKAILPAMKKRAKCALSYHNFTNTPPKDELARIVQAQVKAGADICKVVTTAQKMDDSLTLLQLVAENAKHKIVAFAMGQEGQISRILSPLAGAEFTYASLGNGKESAPGQITVQEMTQIYGLINK